MLKFSNGFILNDQTSQFIKRMPLKSILLVDSLVFFVEYDGELSAILTVKRLTSSWIIVQSVSLKKINVCQNAHLDTSGDWPWTRRFPTDNQTPEHHPTSVLLMSKPMRTFSYSSNLEFALPGISRVSRHLSLKNHFPYILLPIPFHFPYGCLLNEALPSLMKWLIMLGRVE